MATVNLGQISAIYIGTTAPSNTYMMWYDEGNSVLKYYDVGSSTWKAFDGTGVFVEVTGSTMTGYLTLHADPTNALHAATKQYVDNAISGTASTLSGILANGNTTDGTSIEVSTGDTVNFNEGLGGTLTSETTTVNRTWTLPDSDGALLIGTGTVNKVARWGAGNALTDGVLLDNGTTAGIGGIDGNYLFNLESATFETILNVSGTKPVSLPIIVAATGVTANQAVSITATGATGTNHGIYVVSQGGTISRGAQIYASGASDASIGIEVNADGGSGSDTTISVFGATYTGGSTPVKRTIGGGFGIGYTQFTNDDLPEIVSAVVGITASVNTGAYAGYFSNESGTVSTNYGVYINAANASMGNYALVTNNGLVGFGVLTPSLQVQLKSTGSLGTIGLDTTGVTTAYESNILMSNTGTKFTQDLAGRNFEFENDGYRIVTLLDTGGVAIGSHTSVDSQLHVRHSSGVDADGGIRATASDNTPYVYSTPAYHNSLILENEDITNDNTSALVFRAKDSVGVFHDTAFIGTRNYSRSGSNVSAELVFGISANSVISEAMRISSFGDVIIGAAGSPAATGHDAKLYVQVLSASQEGIYTRQTSINQYASSFIGAGTQDSDNSYTDVILSSTGNTSQQSGNVEGLVKYHTKAGHLYTDGSYGHLNLFARSANGSPLYDVRLFTGGEDYDEANLRLTVKSNGKFGFNLAKAGYTGSAVDTPLSDFHVGTGAYFQPTGVTAADHVVVKSGDNDDEGGFVVTSDTGFISGTSNVGGFKFSANNSGGATPYTDDTLTIGLVDASTPNTFIDTNLFLQDGNTGIGAAVANEKLTVSGTISMALSNPPTSLSGFGKLYVALDSNLYFLDEFGTTHLLNDGLGVTAAGGALLHQVAVFNSANEIGGSSSFTFDGTTLTVGGNLIVNGTTTTIESTVVSIADPVFTMGDGSIDDNKDRGIEFKWNQGGAKIGFFGYDDSLGRFTFIPDAVNTGEVFTGAVGNVQFGAAYLTSLNISTGSSDTYFLGTDGTGAGNWTSINNLALDSSPNGTEDYVMTWDGSAGKHKKVLLTNIGGSATPHNLLDGTVNIDTVAASVQRGDIIVGNPSAKWDRLSKGTSGQYLKSNGTDVLYATIDISEVTGAMGGTGTLNEVAYYTGANTITSSPNFIFDGSNMSLFGATSAPVGFLINDTPNTVNFGLSVENTTNGIQENTGLISTADNQGAYNAVAIRAEVGGAGTAVNTAIVARAITSSAGSNIGGYFEATNAGTGDAYAIQLVDGNQAAGKYLKSLDNTGRALWSTIVAADISDLASGSGTTWNGTGFDIGGALSASEVITGGATHSLSLGGAQGSGLDLTFLYINSLQALETYYDDSTANIINNHTIQKNPGGSIHTTIYTDTTVGTEVSTGSMVYNPSGFFAGATYTNSTTGDSIANDLDVSATGIFLSMNDATNGIVSTLQMSVVGSVILSSGSNYGGGSLQLLSTGNIFTDFNPTPSGIQYASDYTPFFTSLSLVHKGYVDALAIVKPTTTTDNAISRWSGITGSELENSGVLISDTNEITGVNTISIADKLIHTGDTDTYIAFGTNTIDLTTGGDRLFGNIIPSIYSFNPDGIDRDFWIKDALDNVIFSSNAGNSVVAIGYGSYAGAGSHLALTATRTDSAQINFQNTPVDKTTPVDGDMWYNGTNLYFRDGTTSIDLLSGGGDVSGSVSSTDNAIVRFDGATGKVIQNSGVTLNDTNSILGVTDLAISNLITHTGDADTYFGFAGVDNQFEVTVGGNKLLNLDWINGITINPSGIDRDFVVLGNTNNNVIHVDAGNDSLGIGTLGAAGAWATVAASTTTKSSINLIAGVNKTTPSSGDLWWNGTNLYFNNGTISKDLLAAASIADGDKGDITVSGSGATWTIDNLAITTAKVANDAITNSKLANMAAKTLKGNSTVSTGDPQDLSVGTVQAMLSSERIFTAASVSSLGLSADSYDGFAVTAQAVNFTFSTVGGTLTEGRKLTYRIKDNGTARTLTWNAIYRAIGVTLPTTTVANKTLYVGVIYNATDTKWDVVAISQEA